MNTQSFSGILDAWNDPQMRHAMVVHAPIVLSIISAVLGMVLAIKPGSLWVRSLSLSGVILLAGSAWMASNSGEAAEAGIEQALSQSASDELDVHEDMGVMVWFFAACSSGLVLLTFIPQRTIRHLAGALAALGGLFIAAWTAVVAHHGGTLVYEHGVGPPRSAEAGSADASSDAGGEGDGSSIVAPDARLVHFEQFVRPILEQNCWGCHNPSRSTRNGGLDLTTMDSIVAGGKTEEETVVVPGDAEGSLMIRAIRYDDPFLQMPPARKGRLDPEEVAALEKWVLEGAVWSEAAQGVDRDWESQQADDEAGD